MWPGAQFFAGGNIVLKKTWWKGSVGEESGEVNKKKITFLGNCCGSHGCSVIFSEKSLQRWPPCKKEKTEFRLHSKEP